MRISILALIAMALPAVVCADTITSIDFENVPLLAEGPQLYTQAGPAQTITIPDVAAVTGGVVLGLGPMLMGVPGVTTANVFATASDSIVGPNGFGLPDTITIAIAPGMVASQAGVPVINGMQKAESYAVTAFAGSAQVSQQILRDIPSFQSAVADLTGTDITQVTITPLDASAWDFAMATMTLTEAAATDGTPVTVQETPEPAPATLMMAALAVAGLLGRYRRLPA